MRTFLGVAAAVVVVAYVLSKRSVLGVGGNAPRPAAPSATDATVRTRTLTRTVTLEGKTVYLPGATRTVVKTERVAAPAPQEASLVEIAKAQALSAVAPAIPQATAAVLEGAGQFVSSGSTAGFFANGVNGSGQGTVYIARADEPLSGLSQRLGDAVSELGREVGGVTPLAGVFGVSALLKGFRGANERTQGKILGASALQTAQFAVGYVPFVGAEVSTGLGALAKTYEGRRAVAETGRVIEQGYTVQKDLVNGDTDALGHLFGGSTHKERLASFFEGINARLRALDKSGGAVTKDDLAAFDQALAEGYAPTLARGLKPYLPAVAAGDAVPLSMFRQWVASLKAGAQVHASWTNEPLPVDTIHSYWGSSGAPDVKAAQAGAEKLVGYAKTQAGELLAQATSKGEAKAASDYLVSLVQGIEQGQANALAAQQAQLAQHAKLGGSFTSDEETAINAQAAATFAAERAAPALRAQAIARAKAKLVADQRQLMVSGYDPRRAAKLAQVQSDRDAVFALGGTF